MAEGRFPPSSGRRWSTLRRSHRAPAGFYLEKLICGGQPHRQAGLQRFERRRGLGSLSGRCCSRREQMPGVVDRRVPFAEHTPPRSGRTKMVYVCWAPSAGRFRRRLDASNVTARGGRFYRRTPKTSLQKPESWAEKRGYACRYATFPFPTSLSPLPLISCTFRWDVRGRSWRWHWSGSLP